MRKSKVTFQSTGLITSLYSFEKKLTHNSLLLIKKNEALNLIKKTGKGAEE